MLFICGLLYVACAISLTSVSFIVPSAQCDFQMTSFQKGLLNGASMIGTYLYATTHIKIIINPRPRSLLRIGMCIGSFIWGYISDSKGRKYALILCMLMDGFFNLVSGVSQIYSIFIFCRMMSGFGYIKYVLGACANHVVVIVVLG